MRRLLVPVLALSLLSAACFGSFRATRAVWSFNQDVSPNKFVQEVVFLAMVIVPVYGIATFADAVILNTVEFWTGSNPLATTGVSADDGRYVELQRSEDGALTIRDGDRVIRVFRDDAGLQAVDGSGQVIATGEEVDGAFVVVDGSGVRTVGPDALARAATGPDAVRELALSLSGSGAVCAAR